MPAEPAVAAGPSDPAPPGRAGEVSGPIPPAAVVEPSRPAAMVAGVLLAAGSASRMGSNKMLLPVGGESVLRGAARRALAAGLEPLLVVLGHQAEQAAGELAGLPCRTVLNPAFAQGITTSLQAGIAAAAALPAMPEGPAAALVMLADMPLVTTAMIAGLVGRYRATAAPLVISDYAGVTAPPMLYDRGLFEEILAMSGESCGKQVVRRHRARAEVLAWPAAALADIDLPEDYARLVQGA
jgi:molybdenum cofactor cytidylyltransferase